MVVSELREGQVQSVIPSQPCLRETLATQEDRKGAEGTERYYSTKSLELFCWTASTTSRTVPASTAPGAARHHAPKQGALSP